MELDLDALEALAQKMNWGNDLSEDDTLALRNAFPEILRRLREADRNKDRWTALCSLWAASAAMELRQREDGRWEIAQIEPSENDVFRPLIGDDPDSVIDVALQERT